MKFAIVNVEDLSEGNIVCDIERVDKELVFMFDNNKIYSIERGGVECEPFVPIDQIKNTFNDIDTGIIKAKIVSINIKLSNKPVSLLDPYFSNNKFMYGMLMKLRSLSSITSTAFAAMLGIDKKIIRLMINDYLIPNDLVTPYHTTYKVTDLNKVNIKVMLNQINGDIN